MATDDEKQGAQNFVERMLNWTQRLVLASEDEQATASGVIVQLDKRYFLLSAGHAFAAKGVWFVETNLEFDPPKMLVLRVKDPVAFHSVTEDFGWAEIDLPAIKAQFKADLDLKYSKLTIPYYRGPLDAALSKTDAYGFASAKAVEYHESIRKLWREPRYEIYMKYEGVNEGNGLYQFRLNRKHKGHDYYKGCSGAPIADAEGRIVSLVVEGSAEPEPGVIWGTPLANYLPQIGKAGG